MLRNHPRILVPLDILKWALALPWLQKERAERRFALISPDPVLLHGIHFLDTKFCLVFFPQIWERTDCAHEVRTFGRFPSMDPYFPVLDVVPRYLGEFDGMI